MSLANKTAICAECDTYVPQTEIAQWTNKKQAVGICLECWQNPTHPDL